jgi:UDP-N-acetylglucosamine 4,6-dehydratase
VITPEHPFWDAERERTGEPVPDGFEFSSDTNDRWLSELEVLGLAKAA